MPSAVLSGENFSLMYAHTPAAQNLHTDLLLEPYVARIGVWVGAFAFTTSLPCLPEYQ